MKKPSFFNWLAKCKTGRLFATIAVFWLIFPPQVFPLAQIVNKYVTTYSVRNDGNGRGDWGFVFNFNNAKSNGGTEADISETACRPESTNFTFPTGSDGFVGTRLTGTRTAFSYVALTQAIQARLARRNLTETWKYERAFFYDCGQPSTVSFSLDYQITAWLYADAVLGTNKFSVALVKPDNTSIPLVADTNLTGVTGWTNKTGTIAATDLTQSGTYKLQINGQFKSVNTTGANLTLQFDNVNLSKTSQFTDYRNDVEFTIKAAPYSSLGAGAYNLEVRARKNDATSDDVQLQVFDGAVWNTKATIINTAYSHATNPDYTIPLTVAEYNNGAVRVRYIDTNVVADDTPGGIKVDYHRIKVDQGVCVDLIQSVEADCGKCHNYGGDITKPWPNTGMHNKHAQTETVADCKWCHPDFTANGTVFNMSHSDGVVTVDGSKIYDVAVTPVNGGTGTYAKATTKTCTNSNCHYNQVTPAWNAVYGTNIERNCSRCHNTGTPAADNAGNLNISSSWPNTKAHAAHDVAFEMDEYSCQSNGSCHPDNRTQHSAVGDGSGASVKMAPNFNSPTGGTLKYLKEAPTVANDGKGRCYNTTCHGGVATPLWDIALAGSGGPINPATECTKCHINEAATTWAQGFATSAKQYNSSITGLHRGTTPTSEMSHASAYLCTVCHNGEPPLHFKTAGGTTGLDTYLPVERPPAGSFVATLGYVAGAGAVPDFNNGTQGSSCSVNNTACHAEGSTYKSTPSAWAREWSWRAYSDTELDRCQVCHGHWGTFKAGVVQPHVNSNTNATQRAELIGSHTDSGNNCGTMCHAQGATTPVLYNHGVLAAATSKTSDVNNGSGVGFTDNGTNVGCNGCHSATDGVGSGTHSFTDANWLTRNLLNGPTVVCSSCHGGSTSQGGGLFNYWPDGTTTYPDRPGEHTVHITKLAAKLGYTMGALTDQQQKTMCGFCHTYTTNPGEGGHADNVAPANVGSFNPLWSVITTNYPSTADGGTAGAYTAGNGTDGVCSNVDCHNNKPTATTPTANDWYDASTSSCIMCHTNAPADATHVAHTSASATYGINNLTCASCHDAATNWSTNTPPAGATHINGTFTATGYTGATYPTVKGSCGVNTCHNNGKNAAAPAYTWGTALTGCGSCHGTTPTTQSHTAHMQASFTTTFGFAAMTCNSCHTAATVTSHINGTINVANYTYTGDVVVTGTTFGNCGTNACHNNGKNAATPAYTWGTTTTNCLECHGNTAATLTSQSHAQHLNCAATFGVANMTCNSCHTAATAATHGNGTVNIAGYTYTGDVLTTGTTFGNCGVNTCHNNGKNAATPAYTWGTATTNCLECHGNNAATLTSQAHVAHINSAATFGLAIACTNCHTAATAATHANGTINLPGSTVFTYTGGDVVVTGTTFGTCGTSTCHRSDASANTAPAVNPAWNAAAQPNCSICHLEVMTSNKHNQHLVSNSLPNATNVNECYVCHSTSTTSGGLATGAAHINGADNVSFNTTYAYEATTATVAGVGAAATCSNTKCHNGVTTPAWNATVSCSSCHNTTATGPLPSAASVAGKHSKHANNDAVYTDCALCHPNAASYTAVGGHADHQNLATNVTMTGITYADAANTAGGINYAAAGATHTDDGTCTSTTGCHGAATLTGGWAAAATLTNGCYACHGGGLTATETGTTKPAVDTIPNPVNNAQYTAQGHGAGTFTGSGVVNGMAASFVYTGAPGCYNCHDSASQHTPAASVTDPYRLGATYAANTNNLCLKAGCHDTPAIATHAKAIIGGTTTWVNNYDYKCVDCHDPHGDTNYYMVRSHISAPTTTGDVSFGSDQYGTPADTAAITALTFTSLAGNATNSYGADGAARGICEICHVDTAEVNYYNTANQATNTHNTAGKCTTCHKHDVGFKGAGCSGCHGGATAQAAGTFNYWPDGTTTTPDRTGEHLIHITRLAAKLGYTMGALTDQQQKTMCGFCHVYTTAPGESGHDVGGAPADLNATSFNPLWSTITTNYPSTADGGTVAAYTPGNGTGGSCSGIDCHNNKATAATSEWYDASTGTCLLCHTNDGSGTNNPTSGLHFGTMTVSATPHDDTFGTGGTCTSCHTAVPAVAPASVHMNGTFTANETTATNEYYTYADYTDAAANSGTCLGGTTGAAGCHGIDPIDAGTWARKWSTTAKNSDGTECANCHGGFNSDWTFGSAASTTDYQVSHTRNWDGDANASEVIGNHSGSTANTNKCNMCHVYGDAEYVWATYHRTDRKITLNSRFTYVDTAWNCTSACHTGTGNTGHNLEAASSAAWATRGNTVQGPVLTCTSCHPGLTSHIDADGPGGTAGSCAQCHTDHQVANRTGTNTANNVYIKTTYGASTAVPTMNQQYASATHNGYIQLGGTSTLATATTEAQMCWACHDSVGVSEWGGNQHTRTGNSAYDFGDLYTNNNSLPGTKTSNWTSGFWRSGKGRSSGSTSNPYWFKRGAIQSTHSVNFDSGTVGITTGAIATGFGRTETVDAVANIRCSWCHDVHGTHNGQKGDPTGTGTADAPYLRGTWKANPYSEDGPPILGMSNWSAQGSYGAVPRANAAPANTGKTGVASVGGWWIDQNSNNPNSTTNVHATSGLCEQCHGTNKTGTWATADLGTLNYASAGNEANLWVSGYNGHANSVINGPGPGAAASAENRARNIFTRTLRGTSYRATANPAHYVDMGLMTHNTGQGRSYRGQSGFNWTPSAGQETTAYRAFAWGTATQGVSGQTTKYAAGTLVLTMATANTETAHDAQANYHTFTCSKCHNPHAGRLPKLMITDCLDTNHNTWEDSTTFTGTTAPTGVYASTRHSQWPAAMNCHRLDARATLTTGAATTLGAGWNRATPWREFNTPNATRSTLTPDVVVP